MRKNSRLFRLTATTAIVGLALGPLLPQTGFAQSAPPPLAPPAAVPQAAPQTTADPPTRVGRLSRLVGQVSFHGIGADHWDEASLNFPVTSGDSFWTQPGASADLGVTNNRMSMDQSTELDIATLDDHSLVATIPQGQLYLRLQALAPGETYTVTTPRGTVTITAPGRYEIAAGDTQSPTRVSVVDGAAQVSGSDLNAQVAAGQTLLITGTDPFQTQVVPIQRDAFLTAQLARERPPAVVGGIAAPAVVQQMTGGEELSEYGTWADAPQYGQVWYPQVAAGYVPYRNGHWAYVAPWGWTWVDAAPWGFAPFHYGRWVDVGGRWGWAPGGGVAVYGSPGYIAPVYAPALVTFFGIGVGVGIGVAAGIGLAGGFGGNVGWCPLGWQEPYHPWYRTSPNYVRNVNVTSVRNVTNITTINNNTTINNYANRAGATMAPASAMALSRPIGQVARPVPAAQFADAHPVYGREPLTPTTATAGVTPVVANQMHLAAPPAGAGPATRPQAPGPAIRTQPTGVQATGPAARPPLENAVHPAMPGAAPLVAHEPAPNTAQHAPGPAIEPHAPGAVAAGTPALRPPVEAARPGAPKPGARTPGAPTPGARTPGAPAAAEHATGAAIPQAHPGLAPQAAPREVVHPGAVTQAHPGAPAPTAMREAPHAAPPAAPPHEQPREQLAQPQVHAPAPRPQASPAQPAAVHAPPPPPQQQQQHNNAAHAAPPPRPQPHPQEKRETHAQGGAHREAHRA